jgi:hypothetical protein
MGSFTLCETGHGKNPLETTLTEKRLTYPVVLAAFGKTSGYFSASPLPVTALTPAAATLTVVPTTAAPTLTVVATTVTAASATATTAQPLQKTKNVERKTIRTGHPSKALGQWLERQIKPPISLPFTQPIENPLPPTA